MENFTHTSSRIPNSDVEAYQMSVKLGISVVRRCFKVFSERQNAGKFGLGSSHGAFFFKVKHPLPFLKTDHYVLVIITLQMLKKFGGIQAKEGLEE